LTTEVAEDTEVSPFQSVPSVQFVFTHALSLIWRPRPEKDTRYGWPQREDTD